MTPGTTIRAEDLFFAIPTRLRSLGSAADEQAKILDVVQRFAVHNPSVAFSVPAAELRILGYEGGRRREGEHRKSEGKPSTTAVYGEHGRVGLYEWTYRQTSQG